MSLKLLAKPSMMSKHRLHMKEGIRRKNAPDKIPRKEPYLTPVGNQGKRPGRVKKLGSRKGRKGRHHKD